MKIKSYKARNTDEALAMVRNDLGPAALIIQTRHIRQGGLLGVMAADAVEVVAASDDADAVPAKFRSPAEPAATQHSAPQGSLFRRLYDRLTAQGVMPQLARSLVEEAICRFPSSPFAQQFPNFADSLESADRDSVLQAMSGAIARSVKLERATGPAAGPKVIALVGPTGVGKTTTIAKLATIAKLRHGLGTAMITIDTYRVAAADQLKTYGELLAVPVVVAREPETVRQAVRDFSDKAVVFIDTTGRSPRDRERVAALRPFFDCLPQAETHLVVSATAKYDDALASLDAFSVLRPRRLIFSKIDESASFGSILNVAAQSQLALSYMTVGQEVPDDIEVTTPGRLAQLLVG